MQDKFKVCDLVTCWRMNDQITEAIQIKSKNNEAREALAAGAELIFSNGVSFWLENGKVMKRLAEITELSEYLLANFHSFDKRAYKLDWSRSVNKSIEELLSD